MGNYAFFVGGSGARAYKAFLYACASGAIRTDEVTAYLVDADSENAAIEDCRTLYEAYSYHHERFHNLGISPKQFSCNIKMPCNSAISPVFTNCKRLDQLVAPGSVEDHAMQWFYTKKERKQPLKNGFYARPNIGCVFFQNFKDKTIDNCINEIIGELEQTNDNDVRIAIIGSIFGGTGASGIPTLQKIINRRISQQTSKLSTLRCGGVLITPYFKVKKEPDTGGGLVVSDESFYSNTREALKYYESNNPFESLYVVGQNTLDTVNMDYAAGGREQKNKPHIVELYAAMAVSDFFDSNITDPPEIKCHIVDSAVDKLGWQSVSPDFLAIGDMLRAQVILDTEIYPYAKKMMERSRRFGYQWYTAYRLWEEQTEIEKSEQFSEAFLEWFHGLHCTLDTTAGNLIWNGRIGLCGIDISILVNQSSSNSDQQESKWKKAFDRIVDVSSGVCYVIQKVMPILSCLGVEKTLAAYHWPGLLIKLFKLVEQKTLEETAT